uniref:hypothetical protein n=1 Tax=Lactococcus garvieae TaxID=1363 RepID=UPI00359C53CC
MNNNRLKIIISLIIFLISLGAIVVITILVLNPSFPIKATSNWTNLFIILFPLLFFAIKLLISGYRGNKIKVSISQKIVYLFCTFGILSSIAAYFSYKPLIVPILVICFWGIYTTLKKENNKK